MVADLFAAPDTDLRKRWALMQLQSASNGAPQGGGPLAAVARALQGGIAGYVAGQDRQDQQDSAAELAKFLQPTTQPTQPPTVSDNSAPRGIRNNNPGNIEDGPFAKSIPGYAGSDGRFAKFDSPQGGATAMDSLLASYGARGINTVGGVINRWAPQSDNNPTSTYASTVAKGMGIDPNAKIDLSDPAVRARLAPLIGKFENGQQVASLGNGLPSAPQAPQANPQMAQAGQPDIKGQVAAMLQSSNPYTQRAGQALASQLIQNQLSPSFGFQTLPDGTIIRTNAREGTVAPIYQAPTKNTFGVIGENRDGQKIYGIINPEKGTAVPVQVPGTASAAGADQNIGLTGDEYLKSLNDPGRADLIKGMVEGRMAPAQMGRYGTQAVQSLLKDAARYEPGFDMTKWNARTSTAKDFASGQAAKNVTSLNTVIGHLGDLADKADALGNSSFTPYNEYIKNPLANVTGSPEVKNFNLARNAVADEMAKVFRGGGLSDSETRQWKENISSAGSPAQLRGAVNTAIGLMESRLNALNEQRSKGMSTQTDPMALLTDKSKATLEKVKKWAAGDTEAASPQVDPAAIAEAKRRGLIK